MKRERSADLQNLIQVATTANFGDRAIVVIPARDEGRRIGLALAALAAQRDRAGMPLPDGSFATYVLANNCTDATADRARRFGRDHPAIGVQVFERWFDGGDDHVGTARRWLMDRACRALLDSGHAGGVIASTDADTRVAPTWLAETWRAIARGADAVGGDIRADREGRRRLDPSARRCYLLDVRYRRLLEELAGRVAPDPSDPWPRHHHRTGASLAVTAEAYAAVGGLPPLRCREDLALVAALAAAGRTIRHEPKVRVVTSARSSGRAAGGMADTLRDWSRSATTPMVEDPDRSERRFVEIAASGRPAARFDPVTAPGIAIDGEPIPIERAIARLRDRLAALRAGSTLVGPADGLLEQVDPIGLIATTAPMN